MEIRRSVWAIGVMVCCVLMGGVSVWASDPNSPYANVEEEGGSYAPASATVYTLPFDPNNYTFLIYENPSSENGENSIRAAMNRIGITNYTVCDQSHPVTLSNLSTHDILIVGWDSSGNVDAKDGLVTSALEQGITGRVILSGHDSDYHTVNMEAEDAGITFFIQEIEYILNGGGTGLLVSDPQNKFDWLPASWEVDCSQDSGGSSITSITQDGQDSGVYDGLTKELMSGWGQSYHNAFTSWGVGFKSFELGEANGSEYEVVTIAASINPMGFDLDKYDDVADGGCRNIDDGVEYTIEWHNTTDQMFYDAYIKDFFPAGVTYPVEYTFDPNTFEFISSDPGYDEETHTYTYPIGTLSPDDSGILQLDVVVNSSAEPGYFLHNAAELWVTVYDANGLNPVERLIATAYEDTLACCWDTSGILYVDKNATGSNTGVSWTDAYTDLQDALTRARTTHCTFDYVIYVAQGTYAPDETPEEGFVLPDNVFLYGGFPTSGCDFADRNPKKYQTILTGLIDEDEFPDARMVVTMGAETLLDGFTINSAFDYCLYGNNVDFTVSHCTIMDSYGYGIYAENGYVVIQWCTINSNGTTGLYHEGEGYTLAVDNSWIMRNGEFGVYTVGSTLNIKNSIVSESDLMEQGREGIRMVNPTSQPKLFNNTIARNKAAGIFFVSNGDPNSSIVPDIQNSIVYYNRGPQLAGINADLHANFCCIQDCNEPNTTNYNDEPGFAYAVDPNGTPDPNNYHLSANSFCIDKANPFLSYAGQVDLDGEGVDRKYGDYVDIGADEVYDCDDDYLSQADVYNARDFDADGLVNLNEFRLFSAAWLTYDPNHPLCDPNNPNYVSDPNVPGYISEMDKLRFNSTCDLDDDLHVGLSDIVIFSPDWLWIACWKLEEINAAIMAMQSQTQPQSLMTESIAVENGLSVAAVKAPGQEFTLESSAMIEESPVAQEGSEVSAETLTEIISFLDEVLLTETDNIEGIEQMKAILQEELNALPAAQER